jgi:macrolide transport system ATP-binding/permease protein
MPVKNWWFTIPLRLKSILLGRRVEQELDEELQFHLEHKIEEGIAKGLSPKDARYAAMRAMDGLEQQKERVRDARRVHWLTDFFDDARFALRSLARTPGFTAFVILTLAVGIGMTAGVFSLVDAVIFKPYPVPHPSNVVSLVSTTRDSQYDDFSYREYLDIRDNAKSYDGVIANTTMAPVGFSADPAATPRVRGGMMVSGNYFHVLGITPALGRDFRDDEDLVPGRDPVIILGPDFWRHEFAGSPSVIGRTVRLNGTPFTVVGVAPDTFPGLMIFGHPDFYMPMAMAHVFSTERQKNFLEDRDDREIAVRARLKPGVTLQQAHAELNGIAQRFEREYPKQNLGRGAAVHTQFEMRTRPNDQNWKFGAVLALLSLAVLLVACTNVAGLLLSRARSRAREIAVRLAIGAGRFRLVRLLLTESLLLSLIGGAAGVAFAYGLVAWFHTYESVIFMTDLPAGMPFKIDSRALVVSLFLSVLSAVLCGLVPALQSSRVDLVNGLKAADVDVPGRKRLWGRSMLIVAQVATSLMLLTASFLMVRGFNRDALHESIGFDRNHLLMTSFDPRLMQYTTAQTTHFYKLLAERARQTPSIQGETLMQNIPLGEDGFDAIAFVPDAFQMPRDRENFSSMINTVDDTYFQTMRISIVHGRAFLPSDTSGSPQVAIVNERFAKHYWPTADAVGKRIHLDTADGPEVEIVGIAQNIVYQDNAERAPDFLYFPVAQHPVARMTLMVRSDGDPLQMVGAVKDIVHSLDPNMPMLQTMAYDDYYLNKAVRGPSVASKLVCAMGVVGVLLTVAGLYGVVAYNVTRRTREIAIRMAIGADRSDVLRLMMGKGLLLVGVGTLLGLIMGFAIEQLMNNALFNSGGVDILAYAVVLPSLFAVTMLAAYLPARKATRIAPTQALRYE